jgi:glycosyltransferase involved in cell wall biosynthesis
VSVSASSREFAAYLRARDAVLRIKAHAHPGGVQGTSDPSAYWTEELENIDYMIEASPLIVAKLRQHAFHITGLRPYDYRVKADGRREHFEQRLRALRELGGDALLVPESPALGGFGYAIDGRLFNVDTLKFYEVLIGMERAGVLSAMRRLDRPVVCEVGAGWAGFAYQFKTLLPRATYVIVDFPELFLFSATYLGALFPDARLLFCGDTEPASLDGWRDADVVFVPNTLAHLVATLPLDLMVNMVSFQEMTDAQVRGYASIAASAGCPLLYSLNRERSPYNTELVSVSQALADAYRLTEVPVLETDYTSAMKKPPKAVRTAERSEFAYRHLVGRLDVAAAGARASRPASVATQPDVSSATGGPRVVLGMPLYNNAANLPEALDSLLAQSYGDFLLVMIDDASSDGTEQVARRYAERDARVRYFRRNERRAMVATWREAVEIAARECPSAAYFAWVSDHDRWHPRWLERVVGELDADPQAVLAYPITRRMSQQGDELQKGPRLFDTAGVSELSARWQRFCREGVGCGDMVYGLIRMNSLRKAGIFRAVLRPDRLLMVELTLQGSIRQVPEVLWFRRQSAGTSVERQPKTLVLAGQEPPWFWAPPWLQHSIVLWREYATAPDPPVRLERRAWVRMLLAYQIRYGWRHLRKSETSHAVGRTINGVIWTKKLGKHYARHAVYNTLVGARALRGRSRRAARRAIYEILMFTHRVGLRGRGPASR